MGMAIGYPSATAGGPWAIKTSQEIYDDLRAIYDHLTAISDEPAYSSRAYDASRITGWSGKVLFDWDPRQATRWIARYRMEKLVKHGRRLSRWF